ncbi:MAG: alpha/beta hydrolase [Bacteroides sp.]|nr:alpha/beta hydrolase [Bacteroides sp.]
MIFIHGGGWIDGNKESRINYLFPYLQRGWNVVNAEYRLGKGTAPDAVTDIQNVFKWIAENAANYYFDLDSVLVSGESAGDHLALFTRFYNILPDNPCHFIKVKAIVNWFGISELEKVYNHFRNRMERIRLVEKSQRDK